MMSAYTVEIRYPDDWFEPERQEAEDALKTAVEVVEKLKPWCYKRPEKNDGETFKEYRPIRKHTNII